MRAGRIVGVLILAAALALPVGCVFQSKQLSLSYAVQPDSLQALISGPVTPVAVDLNGVAVYRDHKSEIRGIADVAFLGTLRNSSPTFTRIEWWITPATTAYTTPTQVRANGKLLWAGPDIIPNERLTLNWNHSAGLVDQQVVDSVLLPELHGDGAFTLYALGALTGTSYSVALIGTQFVMVLDTQP